MTASEASYELEAGVELLVLETQPRTYLTFPRDYIVGASSFVSVGLGHPVPDRRFVAVHQPALQIADTVSPDPRQS